MVITFSGRVTVYSINANRSVDKLYSQSLLANGVYCAEIDAKCEYLIVGSFANASSGTSNGLSIWRILNHEPWLTRFDNTDSQKDQQKVNPTFLLLNKIKNIVWFIEFLISLF